MSSFCCFLQFPDRKLIQKEFFFLYHRHKPSFEPRDYRVVFFTQQKEPGTRIASRLSLVDNLVSLDRHLHQPYKKGRGVCGGTAGSYHIRVKRQRNGKPAAAVGFRRKPLHQKKKHPSGCSFFWWRRGESNPRPKTLPRRYLRVQFVF